MARRPSLSRRATIIGWSLGGVVVVLVIALGALWFVQRGQVLPNTSIAGIDVSGMTEPQVRDALATTVEARETDTVTFTFEGEEHVLVPREVGFRIDVDETVDSALERGRSGLPGDVVTRLRAFRRPAEFDLVEVTDQDVLATWADDLADELDRPEIRGGVTIDAEEVEVRRTMSQGEVVVDRATTVQLAASAVRAPGTQTFELPADTTEQPIADEEITTTAEDAERALAAPLVLRAEDASLELAPADLAAMLEIEEVGDVPGAIDLQLAISPDRVEEVIGELGAARFDITPTSASYSASRTPPATFDAQRNATFRPVNASVQVEPGRIGREFDAELAATQLTELVRAGTREAQLRLAEVEAEFPTERAEELRPSHVIGTFTTYYTAGQVRNQNIQLLADVIDGTLVLPGEQFSINEVSGERSCEKGYQPAGTIVQGELVDTCGGGTSQFGTTTFNAAFFAGVQLDQWRAHSWYISRYPIGREATLSFPVLDVKFTNNTEGAILVKTAHTSTSVTVSLYGQPRATAVSARHSDRSRPRDFETEIRTTSELFQGQERVLQSGSTGFTVSVDRTVELVGGGTEQRTITTVYVPQTRIVERGTRPRPATSVADDDDADGANTAAGDDSDDSDDSDDAEAVDEGGDSDDNDGD
ncbi:MAG: VanW family protein [Nitriliruptoraceae bacterium]